MLERCRKPFARPWTPACDLRCFRASMVGLCLKSHGRFFRLVLTRAMSWVGEWLMTRS